jgi:hypothetical protein
MKLFAVPVAVLFHVEYWSYESLVDLNPRARVKFGFGLMLLEEVNKRFLLGLLGC